MYPEPDLNRHGLFSQRILSPSCLPIPSPGQYYKNFKLTERGQPIVIPSSAGQRLEASAGFEPANNGFANRPLKPLGYDANRF